MRSRIAIGFLMTVCLCGILSAASPTIGVASANGNFLLDRSPVVGNANIFEGSLIETGTVRSDMTLANGLQIRLGSESRGRVFSDRLVLEKGAGQVSGSTYRVEAGRLRIMPASANAAVQVGFGNKNLVEVAAIGGAVRVVTAEGVPVANMAAGRELGFTDQAGAAAPTTLCGKAVRSNGKLMLTDTTSRVTVELKGAGLDQYAGKSISVSGNMSGNDVLQVLSAKRDSCGVGGAAGAAAAGAGAGAGAGAAAGLSTAAITGIVVGGATAGILGGLAATGHFSGKSASQ